MGYLTAVVYLYGIEFGLPSTLFNTYKYNLQKKPRIMTSKLRKLMI